MYKAHIVKKSHLVILITLSTKKYKFERSILLIQLGQELTANRF